MKLSTVSKGVYAAGYLAWAASVATTLHSYYMGSQLESGQESGQIESKYFSDAREVEKQRVEKQRNVYVTRQQNAALGLHASIPLFLAGAGISLYESRRKRKAEESLGQEIARLNVQSERKQHGDQQ